MNILQRLLIEFYQNGLKNPQIFQVYIRTLFCEVQGVYQSLSGSNLVSAVSITNRFKQCVFENIRDKHLVTEYASLLTISPNHLNKTVKTVTGKSPADWINEAIVAEAKVLLCQSNMLIREVPMEVGFDDQSYFTRLYKKT